MEDQAVPAKALEPASASWLRRRDRGWTYVGIELLLVAATLGLCWPTTLSLFARWQPRDDSTYGHGYLILAISLWLLLRNPDRLRSIAPRSSVAAALLSIPVALVWLVTMRAGIQSAHQLLLPVLMGLAVSAALGWPIAFRSAFAIGYLFFALPIWDSANGILQTATVVAADALLQVTGVNAYVEGNTVHLASGVFEIAGGCSGLHFFIVALALAALYGEIGNDKLKVRVQLLALAAVIALLTNWLRVYSIILAGYLTDMQHYLVRVEHYRFGWVVFAIMMAGFFLFARRLPSTEVAVGKAQPVDEASQLALIRGTFVALVLLAWAPAWNLIAPIKAATLASQDTLLPNNPGAWQGPLPTAVNDWKPVFVDADVTRTGDYVAGDKRLVMYTAIYLYQAQGRELVGFHNSVAGEGTDIVSQSRLGAPVPAAQMTVEDGGGTALIRYFYQVGTTTTNRGIAAELYYGLHSLLEAPVSRIVAARAACLPDCESARVALDDLMNSIDGWIRLIDVPEDSGS